MRLTTEHLKTGWLHPRRVVRNVVASHFTATFTTDPDVTAHAIRGAQEYGWEQFLTWGHNFCKLPLANDAALEWVCGEVERTDKDAPSDNLRWHLTTMLASSEISLLERYRDRLLALPGLRPRERQAIETRLELVPCSPAEAWRRLEDHCRMSAAAKNFADAKIPEAELLLEPLVRDCYPQADWDARLHAASIFAAIKCDESATAIAEAVSGEDDDDLRAYLGAAAAAQFDDSLMPLALQVHNENPEDPERGEIRELLVAFSHLAGYQVPDRDEWEKDIDDLDDRMRRLADPDQSPLAESLLRPFGDEDDNSIDLRESLELARRSAEPAIRRGFQVGRNAPCPCGSGKKYKRCCMPDAHG